MSPTQTKSRADPRVDEGRKPAVQPLDGEGRNQALRLLPWAVRRVEPQRADVEAVRRGDVAAQHRGRGLGDRVRAVRLDGSSSVGAWSLRPYSELEPVLTNASTSARRPASSRFAVPTTFVRRIAGAIRLPRVGAVGGEVEDPLRARRRDRTCDRVAVGQVELRRSGRHPLDLREPPAIGARPGQERRLVARRRAAAARRSRR